MAVEGGYLRLSTTDGGTIWCEAICVRPCSKNRALVALPGESAEPLGLAECVVAVKTRDGRADIAVLPVMCPRDHLLLERPASFGRGGRSFAFPASAAARPDPDALLDLERVDTEVPSSGPEDGPKASAEPAARRARAVPPPHSEEEDDYEDADALDVEEGGSIDALLTAQLEQLRQVFTSARGQTSSAAASSSARPLAPPRVPAVKAPAPAPALTGNTMDDLMKLMMLSTLRRELRESRRLADGDSGSDEERVGKGQDSTTKAFAKYTAYKKSSRARPLRVLEEYKTFAKDEMNVRVGDRWSFRDWWRTMPFQKYRSVGRTAYLLCELLDTSERQELAPQDRLALVQAGLVQSLKACHQYALDGGDWKAAWPLTQVKDPFRATSFGGTETELNLIAALLKAEGDLQTRVRGTRQAEVATESEERPAYDGGKGGGKARRAAKEGKDSAATGSGAAAAPK